MRCDEFEARLNDLLDLRLEPAEDRLLSEHADDCRSCRLLLRAYGDALSALSIGAIPAAPAELSRRVLIRSQSELPQLATPTARTYLPHLVGAAAAALAALGLYWPHESLAPKPLARAPASAVHDIEPPRMQVPEVVSIAAERAAEPWAPWPAGANRLLGDVASLWPDAGWDRRLAAKSTVELEEPPLLAEVATGLKPLADSATGAMSFLFDVLPATGGIAPAAEVPGGVAPVGTSDEAI